MHPDLVLILLTVHIPTFLYIFHEMFFTTCSIYGSTGSHGSTGSAGSHSSTGSAGSHGSDGSTGSHSSTGGSDGFIGSHTVKTKW